MRQSALSDKEIVDYNKCKEGATYVPPSVAVSLIKDNCCDRMEVVLDVENNGEDQSIRVKRG
eukprot:8970307-Ditylum_brightwellii.AAC.1